MKLNSCNKSDAVCNTYFIPRRSCSKKRRRRKRCRKGRVTKNPFFNFLRLFRARHCRWTVPKIAIEGAKCWCAMTEIERKKFYLQAHRAFLRSLNISRGRRRIRSRRCSNIGRRRRTRRSRSCPRRRRSKSIVFRRCASYSR
ncbi:hypothetical protein WA026_000199 [Henosepilachna vigintioctopunctata]|uniref:Protamine n=1 Tax=Henosepilachna vigintioctopunctata TaxID=420089 RepID=A0AAW1V335_9CUCU